jgi:hypothetical protein
VPLVGVRTGEWEYNRDFEEGGKKIENGRWKTEKASRIRQAG